jgi:opine dehydrogenase
MRGKDFWAEGRTAESLGIKGMSVKDIRLLAVAGGI